MLDDFFDQTGGDPSNAPALTHVAVVWERTFTRSRPCHGGGTLTVTGKGFTTWDAQAVTNNVTSNGTKTRTGCKYTQADGVVVTLNGNGTWMHERHYLNNAPAGTWITEFAGSFTFSRPGEPDVPCDYDLTRTVNTGLNTRTLTGMSCGNMIDRTDTWR